MFVLYAALMALHAHGFEGSDLAVTFLLPVVWTALKGRQRDVVIVVIVEVAAIALVHRLDHTSDLSEVMQSVPSAALIITSALIATLVFTLVRQSDQHRLAALRAARTIESVWTASESIHHGDDPHKSVCDAILSFSGALAVGLFEPNDQHQLVITALAGSDAVETAIDVEEHSVTAQAYRTGQTVYIGETTGDPRVNQRLLQGLPIRSLLVSPFSSAGIVRGVIVVAWEAPEPVDGVLTTQAVKMLANGVGAALERAALHSALERGANTDTLTGLANRHAWRDRIAEVMSGAGEVWIALFDIDRFKDYNDTRGHLAGDALLASLGEAWLKRLRPDDLMVRWGGEEFALALVVERHSREQALERVERMRALVPDGQTISAGMACWNGIETIESLMARADKALYHAKRSGRNRTEFDEADLL
jgi:diguanylate cyclase (GGDEF)-like protein